MDQLAIDIETWSTTDIKREGSARYAENPETVVLCAAVIDRRTIKRYEHFSDTEIHTEINENTHVFVHDFLFNPTAVQDFEAQLNTTELGYLFAHNATFERQVLSHWLGRSGIELPALSDLRDSRTIALLAGASAGLNQASQQLLGRGKLPSGKELIQLFSVPNETFDFKPPTAEAIEAKNLQDKWHTFKVYCAIDAALCGLIVEKYWDQVYYAHFEDITDAMNDRGWPVDMAAVEKFIKTRDHIKESAVDHFYRKYPKLSAVNFASPKQLLELLGTLGEHMISVDSLALKKLETKIKQLPAATTKAELIRREIIFDVIHVRRQVANSSLAKLEKIVDMTSADGRLRNQYRHCGAGQSARTSAQGIQMQNLPRLGAAMMNLDQPHESDMFFNVDAEELASNIRQLFCAPDDGELIVCDLASIEARMLAYVASQENALEAFRSGKDLYKVMAANMYGVSYDSVTSEQRRAGKVGVLSCGYQAGPNAVRSFAERMGIDFTLAECKEIVNAWRAANDGVVELWATLDTALRTTLTKGHANVSLPSGMDIKLTATEAYTSIQKLVPHAKNIRIEVHVPNSRWFARTLPGVFFNGTTMQYHKAVDTGALWVSEFRKGRQVQPVTIYGGKLTGILIQSTCRELFFDQVVEVDYQLSHNYPKQTKIIGQFHDEVIVEFHGDEKQLYDVIKLIQYEMSRSRIPNFPMGAETKHARRYIK